MQRAVVWVLAGLLYRTARCARVLLDGLQGGSDVSGAALVVMCQSLSRASLSHRMLSAVSVNADAGSLRVLRAGCCFHFQLRRRGPRHGTCANAMLMSIHVYTILDAVIPIRVGNVPVDRACRIAAGAPTPRALARAPHGQSPRPRVRRVNRLRGSRSGFCARPNRTRTRHARPPEPRES